MAIATGDFTAAWSSGGRRDRGEWGELTETEHQELIHYEDLLEQQNECRLEALINLARLRNIDLIALNRQLKSDSQILHAL